MLPLLIRCPNSLNLARITMKKCKLHSILRFLAVLTVIAAIPKTVDADWFLDSYFEPEANLDIYESGGTGFVNYLAVQEGVRANYGYSGVPSNYGYQVWDGTAWPSATFSDFEQSPDLLASAEAILEHDSVNDPLPLYMEASISGTFQGGLAMGAAAALDFTLEIDANTMAVVETYNAFADIDATTGSEGFGFAGIRLYDPTVGINDPGGVNNPYAHQFIFQAEGGATNQDLSLFAEFDNLAGGSTMFQELRLESYAIVFTTAAVPEPGSFMMLTLLGFVAATQRRRNW